MSYQNAHDQIVAVVEALSGLHHCTDKSACDKEDLTQASNEAGQSEGSFLLRLKSFRAWRDVKRGDGKRAYLGEMEWQCQAVIGHDGVASAKGRIAAYAHRFFDAIVEPDSSHIGADVCATLTSTESIVCTPDGEGKRLYLRYPFRLIYEETL